jgi:hypothetical protein
MEPAVIVRLAKMTMEAVDVHAGVCVADGGRRMDCVAQEFNVFGTVDASHSSFESQGHLGFVERLSKSSSDGLLRLQFHKQ